MSPQPLTALWWWRPSSWWESQGWRLVSSFMTSSWSGDDFVSIVLGIAICHLVPWMAKYRWNNRWWSGKIGTYISPVEMFFSFKNHLQIEIQINDFKHQFRDILLVPPETRGLQKMECRSQEDLGFLFDARVPRGLEGCGDNHWPWPLINLCWWVMMGHGGSWWVMMGHNLLFMLTHFMSARWLPGWSSRYAMEVNQEAFMELENNYCHSHFAGRPECKWSFVRETTPTWPYILKLAYSTLRIYPRFSLFDRMEIIANGAVQWSTVFLMVHEICGRLDQRSQWSRDFVADAQLGRPAMWSPTTGCPVLMSVQKQKLFSLA